MKKVSIFDSTLRDGAQAENITFTVEDKLNIVKSLDKLGIDYIEAGNPGSNPKDLEFFSRVKGLSLNHAKLVAFGSTRRRGIPGGGGQKCAGPPDGGYRSHCHLRQKLGPACCRNHQDHAGRKSPYDYRHHLVFCIPGKTVFFDAEHFFDGYKANPEYALQTLYAAERAGATCLVLCDTNGGCFPDEISAIVADVVSKVNAPVGIPLP